MHLQALELFGFKSFADKTIFNFHEGVTAIVGPNGCGKSNVCDAVRWVLGEQSAKSLRGGEMADVIFNGTDSRKALGFAEVSLTFTECAQELGVDWHDVRVTRRIYRDGNSEYFLNKNLCRLKDIHTLFADTGVGRAAYSIMEQGKIDLILSSRPEDRRSVFEEAAGITKYKTQKKEALRKLEATEANLLRVSDIIKEVKRQIGSLQRQAGKARRYQALHADLQTLDTHFSHRKLQALESNLAEISAEIARVSEAERKTRDVIEADEKQLGSLRNELDEIDERITTARSNVQRFENEITTNKNRIAFNEQHARELNDLIARAEREINSAEEKLREHEREISAANALVEEIVRTLEKEKAELEELTTSGSAQRREREQTEERLHQLQLELSKSELRMSAISDDAAQLTQRREAARKEAENLAGQITSALNEQERRGSEVESARATTEAEQQTVEQLFWRVRTQEGELRAQEIALVELDRKLAALDRSIAERESRLDVLHQLNEEGEGLAKGSQALLQSEQFEVAGALATQLDVAPRYVGAIEAALGRNLNAVLLRTPEQALAIIEHLNAHKLGQAAIIFGKITDETHNSTGALPAGAVAWAVDEVRAPAELTPLIRRLLRDVAIFEKLDGALAASRQGIGAATLSGEFISADGILFGGSGQGDSLLSRKGQIENILAELSALRTENVPLQEHRRTIETQIAAASAALENARLLHQNAQTDQTVAVSKIAELEREHHSAMRDLEVLKAEHSTLERQLAAAESRLQELDSERAQLQQTATEIGKEISELTKRRSAQQQGEEGTAARLSEVRVTLATNEQRHTSLLSQRAPMLARQSELQELIHSRKTDIATYQQRLEQQASENEVAKAAIGQAETEAHGSRASVTELGRTRTEKLTTITHRETELREARNRLNELQEKRGRHSVRQTQSQLQLEHLVEHVRERYRIELREFQPDAEAHEKVLRAQLKRSAVAEVAGLGQAQPTATEPRPTTAATEQDLQKLIAELTRQLDNMGPVNLEAVQEYDELEERYRFLESQNNDLTTSRRELLDVIARINCTTQKLFAETFAQVGENFREMFAELFGGGRADLQLLDENDALNCGIDIIAKPPGKQLQSISLLSGGERTMTAVALLFAIYMVRPSPFCVLDEMDAPLDESNINRFIKVLERFVQQSQFIIITHNKRTIAKADILYGVTMEERGVSKLVGMKLTAPQRSDTIAPPLAPPTQRQFALSETERQPSFAAR